MAMTSNILTEPIPGRVAHTANSAMFLKHPNMRDWASYMFNASIPTAAAMVRATEKWPGSVKKTETAYNIAFDHDLPFFDHLSQSPSMTKQFSGYMKSVTDGQGMDLVHLINGFDWANLPNGALVVDVRNAILLHQNSLVNPYRLVVPPAMPAWLWPLPTHNSTSRCRTWMPWSTGRMALKSQKQ